MAALAPETLFQIGQFPVTNTVLNTLFIDAILLLGVFFLHKNMKKIPGGFQNFVEVIIDGFYDFVQSIAGKNALKIFPFVMTFFLFILLSNWSGLLPGFGSIGFEEKHTAQATHTTESTGKPQVGDDHAEEQPLDNHADETAQAPDEHTAGQTEPITSSDYAEEKVDTAGEAVTGQSEEKEEPHFTPLFRNATSDSNVTFALAIVSLIATHTLGIRATGIKDYASRFFSLNPILLFVGILELVSEVTKIISLSFRLFGNIFAGEVVLHTVSSLFAFLFPIPFMTLELIVGLVQALVFSVLTMVFMSIMMTPHHAEAHASKEVN